MKSIFTAAAIVAVATAVILYVQHQLVSSQQIDDPTFDIWR